MSFLKVHGYGNVANVPEVRTLESGSFVITFGLICNEWRGGKDESCYYNCVWFLNQQSKKQSRLIKGATVVLESARLKIDRVDREDGRSDFYTRVIINSGSGLQFPPPGKRPEKQSYQEAPMAPPPTQTYQQGSTQAAPAPPPVQEYQPPPQQQQPPQDGTPPPPPGGYAPPDPYGQH